MPAGGDPGQILVNSSMEDLTTAIRSVVMLESLERFTVRFENIYGLCWNYRIGNTSSKGGNVGAH
jgi:hypothetical protein